MIDSSSALLPVPATWTNALTTFEVSLRAADERTRAILYLAGSAGLRRSEIVQVSQSDLITDPDAGTFLLGHAKGGAGRLIPLTEALAVQRLLGHTSVATTQRYTAPPTNAMRKAIETAA